MPQPDTMPLHDVIDHFRGECLRSRVVNGCVNPLFPLSSASKYVKTAIDFDSCHVLDFGYMFNIGSGKPDALTTDEVQDIKNPIIRYGLSVAYPKMLFVERTAVPQSRLFITYIYQKNNLLAMEYYVKDNTSKHWFKIGHIEDIRVESNGVMSYQCAQPWGVYVPDHAMPPEDNDPINHYLRMSVTLVAMLMRRGDEVEQEAVHRNPNKSRKGIQRKDVASASIIRLHKRKLVKNVVDEDRAVEELPRRSVTPHDRAGTTSYRIKDMTCDHTWVEEYRNESRWRNRCPKCDSCEFWRLGAKVKGGADAMVLHRVVT